MNFDELYSNYSNVELLIIVKKPEDYQIEAIQAATNHLSSRTITEAEYLEAEEFHFKLSEKSKQKQEKFDLLKEKALNIVDPIINPSEIIQPGKWLKLLLFVITIQYAWTTVSLLIDLIRIGFCKNCFFDPSYFAGIINLFYVPLIFFLLYKRRKWGWILLFADNFLSVVIRIGSSYAFFKYREIYGGETAEFLLLCFIKAAFAFFLWRKDIQEFFSISENTKKDTLILVSIISSIILFISFINWF